MARKSLICPMTAAQDKTPLEEIGKRSAEAGAALAAAAHAVGLENHRAMLTDHRRRVNQDHALMQFPFLKQLGILPDNYAKNFEPVEDDDVGGILITGDIDVDLLPIQPSQVPTVPTPTIPQPPNGMKPTLRNFLIAAGIVGVGFAGSAATYFLTRPNIPAATTPTTPDKDTSITIEGH